MQKKYIKLNTDDNYLSFGNLFRIIKEESDNPNTFLQSDLFSIIFDTYEIADSTVNNYCTGLRGINYIYKEAFEKKRIEYSKNKEVFVTTIQKIVNLIDKTVVNHTTLSIGKINSNAKLKKICTRLYSISKNDSDVGVKLSNELHSYLEKCELYSFMVSVLFYVILEKKQPIYINEQIHEAIEKNIYNTDISINDIQDFINIQLNSGLWSLRAIKELAKKNNPFACFEMASLEYYGVFSGKPRYEEAYKYYKIAAEYNHPVATWAIGYLYYTGSIGSKSKRDLYLAFKHFNKARKLKCSNAFNSLGLIIWHGDIPHIKPNIDKAIQMFNEAISLGNIYSYNNLGKIFMEQHNYQKAYDYFIIAADASESWAANQIGEFYRKGIYKNKDLKKAFEYYNLSAENPIHNLCPWSKYNLAKYYYQNGNLEIGIKKDLDKAIELLDEVSDMLPLACEELIYIYFELYKQSSKTDASALDKINYYKDKYEKNISFNIEDKKRIEKNLKNIDSMHIDIPL